MADLNRKYRLKPFTVGNNPVGTRTASEPSAAIQIEDTNGGFLTARMTTVQRDAILSPAAGLLIWNTDTAQLETFGGVTWGATGGGGGGAVASVFGRTGNVIAVAGDYAGAEITVTPIGNLTSTDVQAALVELQTDIDSRVSVVYATGVSPAANNATGAIGVSANVSRQDHKHPAQGVSADAGQLLSVGTDGLHMAGPTNLISADAGNIIVAGTDGKLVALASVANNRVHADNTTVAPATAGQPTVGEITAFTLTGPYTDAIIYYTGDDLPASAPTYVYHVDLSGTVTELTSPHTIATNQDVFANSAAMAAATGQLPGDIAYVVDASGDATVTTGAAMYVWDGTTWKKIAEFESMDFVLASAISPAATDGVGAVGVSSNLAREDHKHPAQGVSADTSNSLTIGTDGLHYAAAPVNEVIESPIALSGPVPAGVRWGVDNNLGRAYYSDRTSNKWHPLNAGNDRAFAKDSTVAPASAGNPTPAEIAVFNGPNNIDTFIYYTGTNINTDPITHVYYTDNSGIVTLIQEPAPATPWIQTANAILPATRTITLNGFDFSVLSPVAKALDIKAAGAITLDGGISQPITVAGKGIALTTNGVGNAVSINNGDGATGGAISLIGANSIAIGFTAPATVTSAYTITLPAAAPTATGQVLVDTDGAGKLGWVTPPQSPAAVVFNATTDWGAVSGGVYSNKILAATHGITSPSIVQTYQDDGLGNYFLVTVSKLTIFINGDVEMQVISTPDARFAGRIVIS